MFYTNERTEFGKTIIIGITCHLTMPTLTVMTLDKFTV